jgi:hypothetical protein
MGLSGDDLLRQLLRQLELVLLLFSSAIARLGSRFDSNFYN